MFNIAFQHEGRTCVWTRLRTLSASGYLSALGSSMLSWVSLRLLRDIFSHIRLFIWMIEQTSLAQVRYRLILGRHNFLLVHFGNGSCLDRFWMDPKLAHNRVQVWNKPSYEPLMRQSFQCVWSSCRVPGSRELSLRNNIRLFCLTWNHGFSIFISHQLQMDSFWL